MLAWAGTLRLCSPAARELSVPGGLVICEVDPVAERHEVHTVVLRTDAATSRASVVVAHRGVGTPASGHSA